MRRWLLLGLGAAGVAAGYLALRNDTIVPATSLQPQSDCNAVTFENRRFTECIAVPGRHRITTRITGENGILYRGFAGLSEDVETAKVSFAVNGGMYDLGSKPIGYYVEDGDRLYPLNLRTADDNFYLKPNGVFFGETDGPWQVMTSDDFAHDVSKRPQFGTQSGPMLVIDGKLHPGIAPNGTSLKIRNAVGVDRNGRAHFVISDEPVSFGTMARMMRDRAGADSALFLDGTVSGLWHPETGRIDQRYPLGPLLVVERRSAS